jgi:hypothetical protein
MSDLAIARTTPVLLGLFAVVALMADGLSTKENRASSLGGLVHERAANLRRCDGAPKALFVE